MHEQYFIPDFVTEVASLLAEGGAVDAAAVGADRAQKQEDEKIIQYEIRILEAEAFDGYEVQIAYQTE